MEISPGIYQVKSTLRDSPAGSINVYAVRGNDEWTLIDTGWNDPAFFDEFESSLGKVGVSPDKITQVIFTHIHPDHYGLAGTLKNRFGTKLFTHRCSENAIAERYYARENHIRELGRWHLQHGGNKENYDAVIEMSSKLTGHVVPVMPDVFLEGDENINIGQYTFEVIWTPGHDRDHICLYERENKLLFSGDHLLPNTFPHIGIHAETADNLLGDYMTSLQSIRNMDVTTVLPGHEHVFDNYAARIDELLAYHQQMKTSILETVRNEPLNAYQIAASIQWSDPPITLDQLPPVVQAGIATKTIAYLRSHVADNKVAEEVDKSGLTVYNAI